MPKYTNQENIPLPLAVLLASDFYEHSTNPNQISATALLKPIKRIILSNRLTGSNEEDISGKIASTNGTAIHNMMEHAWLTNYEQAMLDLGYPQKLIDRVCINPTEEGLMAFREQFKDVPVPVYLERRTQKKIAGWSLSGAFDFVVEDKVYDLKSCGTYSYINGSNKDDYIKQMSIYRWLNPDIIKQDTGSILYWFTDWSALKANIDKAYPQQRIIENSFNLLSLPATESFITKKLNSITALMDEPESAMPQCTETELWASAPVFSYYKNKASTGRSTKNFDTSFDANARMAKDGHVGKVVERKSQVRACKWCPAIAVCNQAKQLVAEGRLVV